MCVEARSCVLYGRLLLFVVCYCSCSPTCPPRGPDVSGRQGGLRLLRVHVRSCPTEEGGRGPTEGPSSLQLLTVLSRVPIVIRKCAAPCGGCVVKQQCRRGHRAKNKETLVSVAVVAQQLHQISRISQQSARRSAFSSIVCVQG